MSEHFLLYPPGETAVFQMMAESTDRLEAWLVRAIGGVIGDLAPVARPLALDLVLACRERDSYFLDADVSPAQSDWHIREADLPEHVSPEPQLAPDFRLARAQSLTPSVVTQWLGEAFGQSPPTDGHVVTLYSLKCAYARARLFGPAGSETGGELLLRDGDVMLRVPVEPRDGGLWVSGPPSGLSPYPPVSFQIDYDDGRLSILMRISWSRWAERGAPEQEALRRALQAVASNGWTPEQTPRGFDL